MWNQVRGRRKAVADQLSVLRRMPHMVSSAWSLAPHLLLGSCILRLVGAIIPIGTLWISKEIVDDISGSRRDLKHLILLVCAEFVLVALTGTLQRCGSHLDTLLSNRFTNSLNIRILEHADKLSLTNFENPVFQDRLERVRGQANVQLGVIFNVLQAAETIAGLFVSLIAVFFIMPWFVAIQALVIVPVVLIEMHFARVVYQMYRGRTSTRRLMDYLLVLSTSNVSVKEVKVFDFGKYLIDMYRKLAEKFLREDTGLSWRRNRIGAVTDMLGSVTYYGCYGWLIFRAFQGAISIGSLLFLAGNFQRARAAIQSLFSMLTRTVDQMTYMSDIAEFFDVPPQGRLHVRPLPAALNRGFELKNVTFAYAGAASPSLRNVSFRIHPEEKIALVGENGAGKSTVIKLLMGLYEPTEGAVLLDGVDIREYDPADLRRLFSIVFQDFVRYDMSLRDNIGMGDVNAATNPQNVEFATWKAGANSVVDRMPKGYEQMLGRRFEEGVDLSGGEWQKIALARASIRDAQVLILDEPTAALDARAEHAVFRQFADLTAGKTAVLISHRLATVRMADRILVLENGMLTEQGSHQELLREGGEYATLFRMQASSYS